MRNWSWALEQMDGNAERLLEPAETLQHPRLSGPRSI